jgi:hypothetical protein
VEFTKLQKYRHNAFRQGKSYCQVKNSIKFCLLRKVITVLETLCMKRRMTKFLKLKKLNKIAYKQNINKDKQTLNDRKLILSKL